MGRNIIDRRVINKHLIMLTIVLTIVLTILASYPMLITKTHFYQNRLTQMETFSGRLEVYKAAVRMFIRNPISGVGLGNYQEEMINYISRNETIYSKPGRSTSHNSYLAVAAEAGLIGFIPLIMLIFFAYSACLKYFKQSTKKIDKFWGLSIIAMTISYFLSAITFNMFFLPTVVNKIYYLSLGLTVGRYQRLAKI